MAGGRESPEGRLWKGFKSKEEAEGWAKTQVDGLQKDGIEAEHLDRDAKRDARARKELCGVPSLTP